MIRRKNYRKALAISFCLLVMWMIMGAGTTIAWVTDTTDTIRNSFVVGELDLAVSYRNDLMTDYEPMDTETNVFRDDAIYEPGYTQVVFLKIENQGQMAFDHKLSVDCRSYEDGTNRYGGTIHLPKYLRFGVVFAGTEPELERRTAQALADLDMCDSLHLNQYTKIDGAPVPAGGTRYAALIVYMPENVGNEANYRGAKVPTVVLGLTVFAQQAGASMTE